MKDAAVNSAIAINTRITRRSSSRTWLASSRSPHLLPAMSRRPVCRFSSNRLTAYRAGHEAAASFHHQDAQQDQNSDKHDKHASTNIRQPHLVSDRTRESKTPSGTIVPGMASLVIACVDELIKAASEPLKNCAEAHNLDFAANHLLMTMPRLPGELSKSADCPFTGNR